MRLPEAFFPEDAAHRQPVAFIVAQLLSCTELQWLSILNQLKHYSRYDPPFLPGSAITPLFDSNTPIELVEHKRNYIVYLKNIGPSIVCQLTTNSIVEFDFRNPDH